MAKKATRLMREATYRWAIWRSKGKPGELVSAPVLNHSFQSSMTRLEGDPWLHGELEERFAALEWVDAHELLGDS